MALRDHDFGLLPAMFEMHLNPQQKKSCNRLQLIAWMSQHLATPTFSLVLFSHQTKQPRSKFNFSSTRTRVFIFSTATIFSFRHQSLLTSDNVNFNESRVREHLTHLLPRWIEERHLQYWHLVMTLPVG